MFDSTGTALEDVAAAAVVYEKAARRRRPPRRAGRVTGKPLGEGRPQALGVEDQFDEFKEILVELARIPSVSAEGFPPAEVERSAEAFADLLRRVGAENVQVLEVPGVHPYVYGDWMGRPGAPTLILYGHHDVVPPGRPERWRTPPFEPVEREGRLYGRGTADDKGGILVHVAAVAAYLRSSGSLPCNVKFVIEGEEEIGSGNLGRFLERYETMLAADAVVLSDTSNFATGVPALTYRLRGLVPGGRRGALPGASRSQRPEGRRGARSRPGPLPAHRRAHRGRRLAEHPRPLPSRGPAARAQRARLRRAAVRRGTFARSAGLLKGVKLAARRAIRSTRGSGPGPR